MWCKAVMESDRQIGTIRRAEMKVERIDRRKHRSVLIIDTLEPRSLLSSQLLFSEPTRACSECEEAATAMVRCELQEVLLALDEGQVD